MDSRELKGMQIAAAMPLKRDAKGWIVPSQSRTITYRVAPHPTTTARIARGEKQPPPNVQPFACNCPDYELRSQPCKHVIAVQYVIRRENVYPDGSVVTEEAKITYTQPWAAYNAAQTMEKEMFLPMLADLCGTLSRPYKGRGRPPLPMSDMAYSAVARVYGGLSARRGDSDVREAKEKGLTATDPHFNSVLRYLRDPEMTPALERLVTLSALPLAGVERHFSMDSTGFSTCTYTRWYDHKWGKEQKRQDWVKLHAATGALTNVVTAAEVAPKEPHDTLYFKPLLKKTAENFDMQEVSADKAYSSKANLQAASDLGVMPFIPFRALKVGGNPALFDADAIPPGPEATAWTRMYHYFTFQRDTFLSHYHQRSNVETTFSMIKRKFGGSLRSKSDVGQVNEVLCKVIAHNLCCVIAAVYELGLEVPEFGCSPSGGTL